MKIAMSVCVFVLVVLAFPSLAFSQATPEEVVKKLYEKTRNKHINSIHPDKLKEFFTSELISNLPKSYEAWPLMLPKGELEHFRVEMLPDSTEHEAFAHVSFYYHGTERLFEYDFQTIANGTWRISNIIGEPGSREEYSLSRAPYRRHE
jgi:hypothetical protein